MITDAIIGLVVGLFQLILNLIPDWAPPGDSGSFGTKIGLLIGILAGYFPLVALGSSVLAVYSFRVVTSIWGVLVFLYDRIPFKAT